MIRVVHCTADLSKQSGGTSRAIRDLTDALSVENEPGSITLLSQQCQDTDVIAEKSWSAVEQRIGRTKSNVFLAVGWPLKKLLHEIITQRRVDILHDHGIWLPSNHHVAVAAKRFGIPLVVHPHGMLEPWAMKYRAWKKRCAWQLYQKRNLEAATLFFATADREAESLRRLGFKQPVAIIPNGVTLPELASNNNRNKQLYINGSVRNILYLGRIHPIKGLLNLIESWGRLRPKNWRIHLAGPDEGGHLSEVMERIQALRLETDIKYVGEVSGNKKKELFELADLFILPSYSENFGVVVAEALAHGIPVITTKGTPWKGLVKHGCGWWVEPTVDALTEALQNAMDQEPDCLQAMGSNGQNYVRKFDWKNIAQQTESVYRWILDQGPIPECVVFD